MGVHLVTAQNLVPNGSFEEYPVCPPSVGGLAVQSPPYEPIITGWYSMGVTPDYMHYCAGSKASNYPEGNAWGNQVPLDGDGYLSLIVSSQLPNEREFAAIELNQPLEVGIEYHLSMYASDADGGGIQNLDCSSNNVGLKLFVNPPYFWNSFDDNLQLEPMNNADVNHSEILTDSINWTHVTGSIVADHILIL